MRSLLTQVVALALLSYLGKVSGFEESSEQPDVSGESSEDSASQEDRSNNKTAQDLYVIRKVVYEIGILTDADNKTEFENRTHEQIDVSFFDPIGNGTFIDLSNIPVPVETNVSGVSVTGILSSNFGNLIFPQNGSAASLNESSFPVFPDKQVKVTRNISTVNKEQSANILSGISDVLGLSGLVASRSKINDDDDKTSS